MDPFTQGVVGAAFAQTRACASDFARFALIGAVGGMAADFDVFIHSTEDPLLALEYHRHFSHSLIFIPVGALACTLLLYPLISRWWRMSFRRIFIPACIGYATHALLDTCTSYGTQLFWPFSNYRASIDIVSVIDPLFTLPLFAFISFAIIRSSKRLVYFGLIWAGMYLLLGFIQNQRAETMGWQLAAERNHAPKSVEAKPSFGNIILWKTVYEHEDRFFVDAVRPGLFSNKTWSGESIAKLNVARDFPWLDPNSQQARDIGRFRWFSGGFVGVYPEGSRRVADIRYSLLPNEIDPLWGIGLNPDARPDQHVEYVVTRENSRAASAKLWLMIIGE